MARKLKTYQTSLGFYDLAIAAPSMKAALEAWGAGSNLFHQGHAKETGDPDIVAATMAKPGVVLKRPAGSRGPFAEHADLPAVDDEETQPKKSPPKPKRQAAPKISAEDSRKAAAAFEREQKRRDAERRKEEAAREKERAKREKLVDKAQPALDAAQREHEQRSEGLEAERGDVEKRIEAEDARWEAEREKLRDALRRARE
ncbi:cell envelope biogenesis protein TolA [Bradyrhizobium diazoefficiens]|nr:cell envelope biogenesis protein TolA [Bradyrhizobium diazoefficiens]MBR0851673.1 cell envelope biogenesis protein TolA [Bradyrhizobium diazoefficiens]